MRKMKHNKQEFTKTLNLIKDFSSLFSALLNDLYSSVSQS